MAMEAATKNNKMCAAAAFDAIGTGRRVIIANKNTHSEWPELLGLSSHHQQQQQHSAAAERVNFLSVIISAFFMIGLCCSNQQQNQSFTVGGVCVCVCV